VTGGANRVLAVDWGERRFGLALSDPLRMLASPLTTLTRRPGKRAPVGEIARLIVQHEVAEVVVGLPLTPEGDEGPGAREVRALGEAIGARAGVPVHYADERLTTAHALKSARRAGVSARQAKHRVDQMAAVGILQGWLDRQGR
jgi:putative Holliday junction resolvase